MDEIKAVLPALTATALVLVLWLQEAIGRTGQARLGDRILRIDGQDVSDLRTLWQSLWKGGEPLFFDEKGYAGLSDIARWYIGGLLKHAKALCAICNPTTNSYKRLVPGYEAPVSAIFSLGNRSAAIRIPKYANKPDSARLEFRPPDATGNPYLSIAAQLMAGLDGVRRRLDPTALAAKQFPMSFEAGSVPAWISKQRSAFESYPNMSRFRTPRPPSRSARRSGPSVRGACRSAESEAG